MITTVIADDEEPARRRVSFLLQSDPEITIARECSDGASARAALMELKPDLAFLDIEMPGLNGLEAIAGLTQKPYTIFVTAHQQHAVDAFAMHADDYLLKPFRSERFLDALNYAKEQIQSARAAAAERPAPSAQEASLLARGILPAKVDGRLLMIRCQEIESIVAEGDYIRISAQKTSYLVRETMQSIHAKLDAARFVRIHRSTIVNLQFIREIEPFATGECFVIMRDGRQFTMSRSHRAVLGPLFGLG